MPHRTAVRYTNLAIKNQQTLPEQTEQTLVEPGSSCTEISQNLPLAIVARLFRSAKSFHHVLVASSDRSSEDSTWKIIIGKISHVQPSKTFQNLLLFMINDNRTAHQLKTKAVCDWEVKFFSQKRAYHIMKLGSKVA